MTEPPAQSWNRDDSQRRVEHPLQRLRGYIRSYVGAEGLLILSLYLALWFWISLSIDYGFFKVFGVDWVQVLPLGFRGVVLFLLVSGLVALVTYKMLFRLFREFRNSALALVLERRYPAELGDRLITAVELADTRIAERYGYSQPMIDQTIRDAAERVNQVPVTQVFNWRRLRRYLLRVLVLTIGLYVLIGGTYCALARAGVDDFVVRFNNLAGIWFERNILLSNIIWPRRAHLELVNFPESGDLRVGRDAPPPSLRVRALKWVVADLGAPEGWRAMTWPDLSPELLGGDMPKQVPDALKNKTMDDIELALDKPETLGSLDANTRQTLRDLFAQLHERAASPRLARKFRELVIPREVLVYYKGETVKSEQTLKKQADNEYSGLLSDLKESVQFTANGEDYYTPYQKITIVPPPSLVYLAVGEEQPAYLHQRPPAGYEPSYLRGKKQFIPEHRVSLSGNASRIDVPAGTNVVLKGQADKPLRSEGGVVLRPQEASAPVNVPIVRDEPDSFRMRFDNVHAALDFVIEMTDADNVVGLRHVVIKPVEDTPPEVDIQIEVVRKTNQGYMITPRALIPWSGKVRDSQGLAKVEFLYTLTSLESQATTHATRVASAWRFSPSATGGALLAPAYLLWLSQLTRSVGEDANKTPEKTPLALFARQIRERASKDVTPDELEKQLRETPLATMRRIREMNGQTLSDEELEKELRDALPTDLLRDINLDPQDASKEAVFNVEALGLRVADEKKQQPRYRLRLWMVATDTNVETGPGVGESKEKYVLLVVSENELLVEIGKEEESLHLKLEDTVNKLKEALNKLEQIKQELPQLKLNEFSPMARRAEEILDTLSRSADVTREVHGDYAKILRELQVNQVRQEIITRVENSICQPLNDILNQDFERTDKSMHAFLKTLEEQKKELATGETASKDMQELIQRLTQVLDAMGEIITLNKLIEQLIELEKQERKAAEQFRLQLEKQKEDILQKAFPDADKPKEEKKPKPEEKKK
jgi:hypothetical protein